MQNLHNTFSILILIFGTRHDKIQQIHYLNMYRIKITWFRHEILSLFFKTSIPQVYRNGIPLSFQSTNIFLIRIKVEIRNGRQKSYTIPNNCTDLVVYLFSLISLVLTNLSFFLLFSLSTLQASYSLVAHM